LVQGNYTATGGEKYLYFRAFQPVGAPTSYYYLDDVSVIDNPCPNCAQTFTEVLGSYGKTDTLPARNFPAGKYLIVNDIFFRNGTVTFAPGSEIYLEGHKRAFPYRPPFGYPVSYPTSPVIGFQNVNMVLNNVKIQAACDTIGGGFISFFENTTNNNYNTFTLTNSEVKDMQCVLNLLDEDNVHLTFPAVQHYANFKIKGNRFLNNYLGITASKFFNANTVDSVYKNLFDSDPAQMKHPYTGVYAKSSLQLYEKHKNTRITENHFKNAHYGIFMDGEVMTVKAVRDTFTNCYLAGVYNYFSWQDTTEINSCIFNYPTTYPNYLGSLKGKAVGAYIGGYGFKADGNVFNGNHATGTQHQGIVSSILIDQIAQYGYGITNNTFNSLAMGINNLNHKTRLAGVVGNTFTNNTSAIFTEKNQTMFPRVNIRCNTFTKGVNSIDAIHITNDGVLTDTIGRCAVNETAGNRYTGYTGGLYFAIRNNNASRIVQYNRSTGEVAANSPNPNIGGNASRVQFPTAFPCVPTGYPSGCIGTGVPIVKFAFDNIAVVSNTVSTLASTVIKTAEEQARMIGVIIDYYGNSCRPGYENVVNQMLPNNLTAYNALSWNLAECKIAQNDGAGAINVITQIVYNNPGDVEISQRANYYTVMMRLSGLTTQAGYRASVQDINILAQVAASNTSFSAAACYALLGIAPELTTGCFNFNQAVPGSGSGSRMGSLQNASGVEFTNIPNPFSISTRIGYTLGENVRTAELKVFDMMGRLVKAVRLDIQANEVELSAEGLNNGVYIYTIEADGVPSQMKRMEVIK
jgi:hypothetical protein